jgi:hypothetical protein
MVVSAKAGDGVLEALDKLAFTDLNKDWFFVPKNYLI